MKQETWKRIWENTPVIDHSIVFLKTVINHLSPRDTCKLICSFTLERSLSSARSVGKTTQGLEDWRYILEPIQVKSHLSAKFVGKALRRMEILRRTWGSILERSHSDVSLQTVEDPLQLKVTWLIIRGSTPMWDLMYARYVALHSWDQAP